MALVIDTHCHLGPWLLPEELLAMMDEAGVDKAVVFPCPSNWSLPSPDNYYHTNDYIAEAQRGHPDRLLGFACVNPQFSGDTGTGMPNLAARELRRCVVELGLRGIKLHPEVHCFTVPSLVGSELMETVLELQQETGRSLPIICHGMTTMGAMPDHFAMLAARYPSVPIIIAHGGGFQNLYFTSIDPAAAHDNLFVDLAMCTIDDCHLLSVASRLGVGKVLFGTDHFARSQRNLYRNFLFVLEGAFPDPADRAQVLGSTAARLLDLA
jgi:predicted TIM-barrel fold metal-dependent hydrolase